MGERFDQVGRAGAGRAEVDLRRQTEVSEWAERILASNAAVEFITMMDALDRLDDAAPVLAHLATAGDFGALAVKTLVADAAAGTAAGAGPAPDPARRLDVHQTLEHMRDVLDQLDAP